MSLKVLFAKVVFPGKDYLFPDPLPLGIICGLSRIFIPHLPHNRYLQFATPENKVQKKESPETISPPLKKGE